VIFGFLDAAYFHKFSCAIAFCAQFYYMTDIMIGMGFYVRHIRLSGA
jgi:hypothetical protein